MSKPVTRERLLATLAKIRQFNPNDIERKGDIVCALASYGLKTSINEAVGVKTPTIERDRTSLELDYYRAPRNKPALEQLLKDWRHGLDRKHRLSEQVYRVQEQQGISGIEDETVEYLADCITYPWTSEDLPWIGSDLNVLRQHKEKVVDWFLEQAAKHGLKIWQRRDNVKDLADDDWDLIEPQALKMNAALSYFDWTSLFTGSSWHDNAIDELHLSLGRGLEPDSIGSSLWFAAGDIKPAL